jgi:two-component system LytT family response regulator
VRALIVDDEPPARNLVREYLEDIDSIEVIGECGTGREAVATINDDVPDLVFLDVQMPGLDGFDVLEQIDVLPDIIFSTAYDEYAIQAFDAGAVDYLLKPYSRGRFQKAVERALERHEQDDAGHADRLASLLQEVRSPDDAPPERLYVRHGDKIIPVDPDEIRWVEAAGDYAKIHTMEKTYLSSMGIGKLAERLDDRRFARVHRSHIIAFPAVDHLRSDGSGGYRVILDDGTKLRVSRSYAPDVRDRLV